MPRDLFWAVRWLGRNRWLTAAILSILALGIGVNTAVFSIVDAVLLRPLPYDSPQRLVRIQESDRHSPFTSTLGTDYWFLKGRTDVFADVLGFEKNVVTMTGSVEPSQVFALDTQARIFSVLGAQAQLGRPLIPSDDSLNAPNVVVLSDRLWRRLFHSDPKVVGRTVTISDRIYTVAGVMPSQFEFPSSNIEIWMPIHEVTDTTYMGDFIGVLKPGVKVKQAQAAMAITGKQLERQYPKEKAGVRITISPWRETLDRQYRLSLILVFAAVGLVLLIACANVGSLLLGRTVQRQKEIAIRAALGAGFWRVMRQLACESLVLAAAGSVVGITAAHFALQFLVKEMATLPIAIPRMDRVELNGRVLLFNVGLCVLLACLCSLAPVLQAAKTDVQIALRSGQASTSRRSLRLFSLLIAFQAGFAFLLLAGSGLLLRSLIRVQEADKGFRPDHVLTMRVPIGTRTDPRPAGKYDTRARQVEFYREILERIERIPGVEAAAVVNNLPLSGFNTSTIYTRPDGSEGGVATRTVSPHYFAAMGTPLLKGRFFTDADGTGSQGVAIINEYLATQLFPGRDPIGQFMPGEGTHPGPQVVGVVKDAWQGSYDQPTEGELCIPARQYFFGAFLSTFVIRTSGDPLALADTVRKQVWAVDPNEPVTKIETMNDVIQTSLWRPRFSAWVFSVLGALALLLTTAGIYGVVSYTAALKTKEAGIRMALGATPAHVVAGTLRDSMIPLSIGLSIGVAAALGLTHLLRSILYETSSTDPTTFFGATALILLVGAMASIPPVWKTATGDPLTALRTE